MEFSGQAADDLTDLGRMYDVRGTFGLSRLVGAEAAYLATNQSINALGLERNADLNSNGVEVVGRLNLDWYAGFDVGPLGVAPFVFGGFAYQRFSLSYVGFNTSDVADDDNVLAIPFGAGLDGSWNRVLLGVRMTYRATFDEDMFFDPFTGRRDMSMSHWNLTARAGYEF